MTLGAHDIHFVFSDAANHCSGWNARHESVFAAEMRNAATGGEGFGHDAHCPPGTYLLGRPSARYEAPFGFWFTLLLELPGHHEFDQHNREGIGVHGGGSGLPNPFADNQGWVVTRGCLRLANHSNAQFVALVQAAQRAGGCAYLTVIQP